MPQAKSTQAETECMILRQSNKISRSPTVPGLRQAKVYRYFLLKARKELLKNEFHKVYQEELKDYLGSNDWENLRESVERIKRIDVRWDLLPQKGGGDELLWGSSPLLADVEIRKDSNGCIYFLYSFSPKMRAELANPKFFRDFDLNLIRDFQSSYSLKFYEFCLAAINPGQTFVTTEFIPKETFWELLGLGPDEYKNYYNFKQRVVKPAIREVNEMTDLHIELVRKRRGPRKYEFAFKIKRQVVQKRLRFDEPSHEQVFERFQKVSVPTKKSLEEEYFSKFPENKADYKRNKNKQHFASWLADNYFLDEEGVPFEETA